MRALDGWAEETMTSNRPEATLERPDRDVFDDDVTWHGLVERAMRSSRLGKSEAAVEDCVREIARCAVAAGLERMLFAGVSLDAMAYVRALLG